MLFSRHKLFNLFYSLMLILTVVYSASVVYGLDIGFQTTSNFGSLNKAIISDNDYGVKTIGYLVRSGELDVSSIISERHGFSVDELGVLIKYEGAYYYLGNLHAEKEEELSRFENFVVVHLTYWNNDGNTEVPRIAAEMNLSATGYVKKRGLVLATIYSNKNSAAGIKTYEAEEYNRRFDEEFGSMEKLVKISLGHY
jgi:hypothetical protein